MCKSNFFSCLFFILIFTFLFAVQTPAQEQVEIKKLIDSASVDTQESAIFNYTYLLKASYEKRKKFGFGRKFTKVYEAIIPSRFNLKKIYTHQLILIKDSENPISQSHIDNVRKELVDRLELAEKEADKPVPKTKTPDGGYWTMKLKADEQSVKLDIYKMLEIVKFSNLQHRQINGSEVITIDFSPQAAIIYDNALSYMSKLEGQIWIDPESNRIFRVEGFPIGTLKEIKNKSDDEREAAAVLLFTQIKVAEGFWFPQTVRLDFTNHPEIFETVKMEFSFTNYRKATVDVRNVRVNAPQEASDKDKNKDTDTDSDPK